MGDSYNCQQVDPMMTFLCNIDGFHLQDIPTLDFSTMDSSTPDPYWADDKQSKARNSDSKYRQMALVGFDT